MTRYSSWSNEVTVCTVLVFGPTAQHHRNQRSAGVGDFEQQFRLGVVADHDGYRMLLLDFNAAYPIVDPSYAEHYMRGFQKTTDGLPYKFSTSCKMIDFSDHHETGTLKEIFDWIQDQGRGKWSFRMNSEYDDRTYNFEFFFEDEMTGVWGRMHFSELVPDN